MRSRAAVAVGNWEGGGDLEQPKSRSPSSTGIEVREESMARQATQVGYKEKGNICFGSTFLLIVLVVGAFFRGASTDFFSLFHRCLARGASET